MKKTNKIATLALGGVAVALMSVPDRVSPVQPVKGLLETLVISPAHAAQTRTYHMRVDGLTCPFCAKTSEKALRAIPGVKTVSTNLKKGVISVCAAPSAGLTASRMKGLFASKGFTFRSMSTGRIC